MKQRRSRDSKTDDAPRMEWNFLSVGPNGCCAIEIHLGRIGSSLSADVVSLSQLDAYNRSKRGNVVIQLASFDANVPEAACTAYEKPCCLPDDCFPSA
jgi:hypothetical protein